MGEREKPTMCHVAVRYELYMQVDSRDPIQIHLCANPIPPRTPTRGPNDYRIRRRVCQCLLSGTLLNGRHGFNSSPTQLSVYRVTMYAQAQFNNRIRQVLVSSGSII